MSFHPTPIILCLLLAACAPLQPVANITVSNKEGKMRATVPLSTSWAETAKGVAERRDALRANQPSACALATAMFSIHTTQERLELADRLDQIYQDMTTRHWELAVYPNPVGAKNLCGAWVRYGIRVIHINDASFYQRMKPILLHEISHVAVNTQDFGYIWSWKAQEPPTPNYHALGGKSVQLTKAQALNNADTYSNFVFPKFW